MSDPAVSLPARRVRSSPRGLVLLADDEDAVRWVGRRFLEADGWSVLEATDGFEALQIIGGLNGRLDLVITDLNMPRVTGRELAEVLSVFRPRPSGPWRHRLPQRGQPRPPAPHPAQAVHRGKPDPGSPHGLWRLGAASPPAMEHRRRARRLRELTSPGGGAGGGPGGGSADPPGDRSGLATCVGG